MVTERRYEKTILQWNWSVAHKTGICIFLYIQEFDDFPPSIEEAIISVEGGKKPHLWRHKYMPVAFDGRWRFIWNSRSFGEVLKGLIIPVWFDTRTDAPEYKVQVTAQHPLSGRGGKGI